MRLLQGVLAALLAAWSVVASAGQVQVAVAANLAAPMQKIAAGFARGQSNAAATALLQYLKSDAARAILRGYGYTS